MKKRRDTRRRKPRPAGRTARLTPTIVPLDDARPELARSVDADRGARLTGGDLDADRERAEAAGDEAVGGSTATPDQDVVDEIGRALGVEQADGEELHTSDEILRARDRFRWHLERDAADEAEGHRHHRRGGV